MPGLEPGPCGPNRDEGGGYMGWSAEELFGKFVPPVGIPLAVLLGG